MMDRRYVGVIPTTLMTLPHVGEIEPGAVLSGTAAEAVAAHPDFVPVDQAALDEVDVPESAGAPVTAASPKARKSATSKGSETA